MSKPLSNLTTIQKALALVFLCVMAVSIGFQSSLRLLPIGLGVYHSAQATKQAAQEYFPLAFTHSATAKTASRNLQSNLAKLSLRLGKFNQQAQNSTLSNQLAPKQLHQLDQAQQLLETLHLFLSTNQTYILLFQNTEEIRATGGFMGSYAKARLEDGLISHFQIQDIYVPDGQFEGFIAAPPGAEQYLSGGQGLRLRDANWYPDFPTSAQNILSYFAWGKEPQLDGVIAINLSVVEKILTITGPIELADYQRTISADNFSDVARADRSKFFPGSQQKKHFLSVFFNQLLLAINDLDPEQQMQLATSLLELSQHKELQFFTHHPELQQSFRQLGLAGTLQRPEGVSSLMLVESNVGINKANQHVSRSVEIDLTPNQERIVVTFTNRNLPPSKSQIETNQTDEADHLAYVNYQRLITSPEIKIKNISFDHQKIEDWDQENIFSSHHQSFIQTGFLITTPEESTKKLTIEIEPSQSSPLDSIWLQKQSGLPATPYHLRHHQQTKSFELNKDRLVKF